MKSSTLLFVIFLTGTPLAHAEGLSVLNTQDVFDHETSSRLDQYFYQTLFNSLETINTKLTSVEDFRWDLSTGRILLRPSPTKLILADHFNLLGSGGVPVGPLLSFGGSFGENLLRLRPVADTQSAQSQPSLKEDLNDWQPTAKAPDVVTYKENIEPWINQAESETRSGDLSCAKSFFGENFTQKQYLDLFAGIKVPFEMPWTAERIMNPKKFHLGDLASFASTGGLFARVGPDIGNIGGSWAGLFLQGQFRFGILKTGPQKVLLRIEKEKDQGENYNLFDIRFRPVAGHGVLFGRDLAMTFRPITLTGRNYDSKIFSRTFEIDLSSAQNVKAYNAALQGNMTLLDDLSLKLTAGVTLMSERYTQGHYQKNQFGVSFGPIQWINSYKSANEQKNFWDERGNFELFDGHGERTTYADINILALKIRQTSLSTLSSEAYTKSPDGPFRPKLSWKFEEVNFEAKAKELSQMKSFVESLVPETFGVTGSRRPLAKFRAAFTLEVTPRGIDDFQSHSVQDVWTEASKILFHTDKTWKSEVARVAWLEKNANHESYNLISRWAAGFANAPAKDQYKPWLARFLDWQRTSHWDALGVQLFMSLIKPKNRYLKLEFTAEDPKDSFSFEEGIQDLTPYPDDWEYFKIPEILPQH